MSAKVLAFILCRALSVVAFLMFMTQASTIPLVIKYFGGGSAGREFDSLRETMMSHLVFFTFMGLTSALLWVKAAAISRMFVPDDAVGQVPAGHLPGRFWIALLGGYVITRHVPELVNSLWVMLSDEASHVAWARLLIEPIVGTIIGIALLLPSTSWTRFRDLFSVPGGD